MMSKGRRVPPRHFHEQNVHNPIKHSCFRTLCLIHLCRESASVMEFTKEYQSFTDVGTLTATGSYSRRQSLPNPDQSTPQMPQPCAEQIGILGYWDTRNTSGQDEARLRGIGPATAESVQWTYCTSATVLWGSNPWMSKQYYCELAP